MVSPGAGLSRQHQPGRTVGLDLGDEQDGRKGTGERSCAAAAPGGVSGWMQGRGHSLTTFVCTLRDTEAPCSPCCHMHVFSSKSSQPVVCVEGTFYLVCVGLCCFISGSVLRDQGLFLSQTFIKCFWATGTGWLAQGGVFFPVQCLWLFSCIPLPLPSTHCLVFIY